MHLLVLDDDERITAFVASVALRQGWTVETVTHETMFQTLFQARRPDAVMLDLQLGASDGIEQLRFLHRHSYSGAVTLMSGFDARVLAVARQVGHSLGIAINTVIEKPARAARIAAVLGEIEQGATTFTGGILPAGPAAPDKPGAAIITPASIAEAISADRMELHLQPIISANDGKVARAEGLIRWRRPNGDLVSPDRFVPIAEQDETVIDQLTRWVIRAATMHYHTLATHGFDIQICVNVSGRNLRSLDFPDQVAALLRRSATPTGAIGLEVTESVAMRDVNATADILARLRLKGFTLAIDDFGTGYSSLEALRRMPFSTIKIDKGFVSDLRNSRDALTIVRSVIDLSRNMGLSSVAEGVDSGELAAVLVNLGVGALQGYHFSRPLPFSRFVTWLEGWSASEAIGITAVASP